MRGRLPAVLPVLALLVAAVSAARAQSNVPGQPAPGPAPAFSWERARPVEAVVDPLTGETVTSVYCDENWCVAPVPPGMSPDQFENDYLEMADLGSGCLNSTGQYCVLRPNSEAADQWLRDQVFYRAYALGDYRCVMLNDECTIEFDIQPPSTPTTGDPDRDHESPEPSPTVERGTAAAEPSSGSGAGSAPRGGEDAASAPTPAQASPPAPRAGGDRRSVPPAAPVAAALGCPDTGVAIYTYPPRPVVVGQDPERRGADILVVICTRPAVFEWTETVRWCQYSEQPVEGWDGCDYDMDGDGRPDHPGDPHWTEGERHIPHREVVPDRLDFNTLRFTATLTGESQAWILGELARKYPGATVRKPEWDLIQDREAHFRLLQNYIDGQQRHVVVFQASRVPFLDPGEYTVEVRARTQGVWLHGMSSPPRLLTARVTLKVWLLDSTLAR